MKFVFDTCRICLGNAIDGRLISPCVCKGSMKYVHVYCLDKWRHASPHRKHFFECELCKYNYSFRRTWLIRMLQNRTVIHMLTAFCFLLCSLLSGVVVQCMIGFDAYQQHGVWSFLMYGSIVLSIYGMLSILFDDLEKIVVLFEVPQLLQVNVPHYSILKYSIYGIMVLVGCTRVLYRIFRLARYYTEVVIYKAEHMIENV